MSITLSVCIPTHNRARLLDEAIASVAAQPSENVEIVVCDNASTDNTEEVVTKWQSSLPRLVYYRWARNMGADRNFLKVIDLAGGEYCWLLGSDDKIAEGAIEELLPLLGRDDILLVDYIHMSFDMSQVMESPRLLRAPPGTQFKITQAEELRRYLAMVKDMSGLFAYISSIIVRKSAWTSVPTRTEFIGSAWIHVTKSLDILCKGGVLHYIGKHLVLNRSANDSFLAELGRTRRILIDLDYVRIAKAVFAHDEAMLKQALALLERWFFSWRVLLGIRRKVLREDGAKGIRLIESVLFSSFREASQYRIKNLVWPLVSLEFLDVLHSLDSSYRRIVQTLKLGVRRPILRSIRYRTKT